MTLEEAIERRRSVRLFKKQPIDAEVVKNCLRLAALAPNSSNMQLWEFHHVVDAKRKKALAAACLGQSAAASAQHLVVFTVRPDRYRRHAQRVFAMEEENVKRNSPQAKQAKRIERYRLYYGRIMPFLYARFLGLLGLLRKLMVGLLGLFRPIVREVSEQDMRVVMHKSCALAAQNFMLAMSSAGYDTCPMEGFDSRRIKKVLGLAAASEINMVVGCGIRDEGGVWGQRMRLPFEESYHLY